MIAMLPLLALGGFGLLIGSFLNVVVYRVPRGLSVVSPASACPGCGSAIAPRDNVPLVSWALLRGACRNCAEPISARYPLVELLTGVLFVIAALRWVPPALDAGSGPAFAAALLDLTAGLYFAAITIALAAIDIDLRRLPDAIVLPAYAVGLVLVVAIDVLRDDPLALALATAGAGASVVLYLALALAKPGGMGLGDVKLAGVLGLFLGQAGLAPLVVGVAAAFLLAGVFGVALILSGRAGRGSTIPFGPWMLAGAWVGFLAGSPIADGYLRLVGLA